MLCQLFMSKTMNNNITSYRFNITVLVLIVCPGWVCGASLARLRPLPVVDAFDLHDLAHLYVCVRKICITQGDIIATYHSQYDHIPLQIPSR